MPELRRKNGGVTMNKKVSDILPKTEILAHPLLTQE
nr:MAG TPA: hypothetical protein [Caudoviricetes sp.]